MRAPEVLSFREFRAGLAATLKRVQGEGPVFVGSHRKPEAVIMSVAHYRDLVEISERRAAVAEALASVRAEGLEPSDVGMRALQEIGSGQLTEDEAIAFLRERKTVIDPTQSWNELLGHAAGAPIAAFQPGALKIPAPLNRVFSNAGAAGIDAATARTRLERGLRIVKALHDAGVPIVVGTDEGIPGHSVHREIELYVEAGLTPMEALQAATIVSARAMKMDGELGTIERGKRADLVVLNANPLDAISNIRSVRWTISDGRVYDAPTLWRSVRFQP